MRWQPVRELKKFWHKGWSAFFDALLNVPDCTPEAQVDFNFVSQLFSTAIPPPNDGAPNDGARGKIHSSIAKQNIALINQ
jgi:hypothetical protein